MTDPARLGHPCTLVGRLPPGTGVIFRHYGDGGREAAAHEFAAACRHHKVPLLIAGDWRLALAVGAQGLHLPEWMLSRPALWRRAKPGWWISAAVHGPRGLALARRLDIDAVTLSPVFATPSHPEARPLGPIRFAHLVENAAQHFRVYALGGLSEAGMRRLKGTRAYGWAGIGAWAASSPPVPPPQDAKV